MSHDEILVGHVVKPHGIRGEVVVVPLTDVPERFAPGVRFSGEGRELEVVTSRPHQGRVLIAFAGVNDRTQAEALRGIALRAAPRPHTGEMYLLSELVGARVVDESGGLLGEVVGGVELPDAAAYDLLEVRREDGSTWLLPAVDEYVAARDDTDRLTLVVVAPPQGLLDADEAEPAT